MAKLGNNQKGGEFSGHKTVLFKKRAGYLLRPGPQHDHPQRRRDEEADTEDLSAGGVHSGLGDAEDP